MMVLTRVVSELPRSRIAAWSAASLSLLTALWWPTKFEICSLVRGRSVFEPVAVDFHQGVALAGALDQQAVLEVALGADVDIEAVIVSTDGDVVLHVDRAAEEFSAIVQSCYRS